MKRTLPALEELAAVRKALTEDAQDCERIEETVGFEPTVALFFLEVQGVAQRFPMNPETFDVRYALAHGVELIDTGLFGEPM